MPTSPAAIRILMERFVGRGGVEAWEQRGVLVVGKVFDWVLSSDVWQGLQKEVLMMK